MKRFLPVLLAAAMSLIFPAHAKDPRASYEESLELHKIAGYWQEKNNHAVKNHIAAFLEKNPKSSYCDQLYAMLGDVYFQEKNFAAAAATYDKIAGREFVQKTRFQHLHSLYETKNYEKLTQNADILIHDPTATAEQVATILFEQAEGFMCMAIAPENAIRKKELMQSALAAYNQTMQTKFADLSLLPQATIYAFLEEHAKAASLYLLLARKDPAKKEEHLFQAGCMQLKCDKKAAVTTFGSVAEMGGKMAHLAAYNVLSLLFQEKRYKELVLSHDKLWPLLSEDRLPLAQYCLGKSLLHMQDYRGAIDFLVQSLSSKSLDRTQEMDTLIALVTCAKETEDLPLFEKTLGTILTEFPKDAATPHILLLHTQMCRDKKEWANALTSINTLLEHFPQHPQKEALLYDRALLLVQQGKLQEGATEFEQLIQEFPQSSKRSDGIRHSVVARQDLVKTASKETLRIKQKQLIETLQLALQETQTFSSEEKQKMRYLLGQTLESMGDYSRAAQELEAYVRDFPNAADAYLLLAHCYKTGLNDMDHFLMYAEKALALQPQLPNASDLHLTLYNTYFERAQKAPGEAKSDLIAKAAGHLYLSLDKPIHKENLRWLASYYFQQFQNKDMQAAQKAAIVLEKLLDIQNAMDSLSLDKEGECMRLAEIYAQTDRNPQRAALLEALVCNQRAHPELNWKYQRMAQFELGKTFLGLNAKEKAFNTFQELTSSSSHLSSYFAIAAELESAKLEFSMLSPADLCEESPNAMAICDKLKNVLVKRKLYSEPLHLEAALCYIDIRTQIAPADQKNDRRYALLATMKESFSSQEDPLVQEYLIPSEKFPDKVRLYRQYLTYLDAEMLRLTGLNQDALSKFNQLLEESPDATLASRIHTSTKAMAL